MADTPKFVGIVFEGDGLVLVCKCSDIREECEGATLREWQQEQAGWENAPADERPTDPPMWDVYQRIRAEATVVHPPNLGAL